MLRFTWFDCGVGFYMNRKRDSLVLGSKVALVPYRPEHVEKYVVWFHSFVGTWSLAGTMDGCRARNCACRPPLSRWPWSKNMRCKRNGWWITTVIILSCSSYVRNPTRRTNPDHNSGISYVGITLSETVGFPMKELNSVVWSRTPQQLAIYCFQVFELSRSKEFRAHLMDSKRLIKCTHNWSIRCNASKH